MADGAGEMDVDGVAGGRAMQEAMCGCCCCDADADADARGLVGDVGEAGDNATIGEISLVRGGNEEMLDEAPSKLNTLCLRSTMGDMGISWAAGCGEKPVMQSMTRTVLSVGVDDEVEECMAVAVGDIGWLLGVAAYSLRSRSRLLVGWSMRVVRWIEAYL